MKKLIIIISSSMLLFMGLAVAQNGMNNQKEATNTGKSSALYSCPMHPEVTSMEPGECPKCGMKLKKAKTKEHQMKMGCCMLSN